MPRVRASRRGERVRKVRCTCFWAMRAGWSGLVVLCTLSLH